MKARGWQVLIVLGGILAVVGASGLYNSFSVRTTETNSIPSGAEWHLFFEFNVLTGGSLRVDYTVTSTGTVDLFVFAEGEYRRYVEEGGATSLHAENGVSEGTFEISLPGSGKYFMAIQHGSGFEDIEQSVQTTIRLLGIDPTWFYGGIAALVVGIVLVAVGLRRKRKSQSAPTGPLVPPRTDVTFYPESRPPEPPSPP